MEYQEKDKKYEKELSRRKYLIWNIKNEMWSIKREI